jgi:hypothetical protein
MVICQDKSAAIRDKLRRFHLSLNLFLVSSQSFVFSDSWLLTPGFWLPGFLAFISLLVTHHFSLFAYQLNSSTAYRFPAQRAALFPGS